MIIAGIDGGLNGGIALLEASDRPRVVWAGDIPTMGEGAKRRVRAGGLIETLRRYEIAHAFIERAQAMPAQGSSSGFIYGRAIGAIEATIECMSIPLTPVEAMLWKKAHGLTRPSGLVGSAAKIKSIIKENSRQRAIMLFPECPFWDRKMDHDRAEAALIGLYGLAKLNVSGFLINQAIRMMDARPPDQDPDPLDDAPKLI